MILMFGLFSFLPFSILHLLLFLGLIAAMIGLIIYMLTVWASVARDTGSAQMARDRGLKAGQARVQSFQIGIDADSTGEELDTTSRAKYTPQYVQPAGGSRLRGSFATTLGIMMMVFAIAAPVSSAGIEFGAIKGRFPCGKDLPCGRDNTFFEMHMDVRPPLDRAAVISETPWGFAPWDADDRISTPVTCDPEKSGQCYMLNQGTLRVEVEASRPYWRYDISRYPVYEFASAYKIHTTVYNETSNFTGFSQECDTLLGEEMLFGDNGPCWQHECGDGSTTVVTETVGIAPGCGSFIFLHPYPRLTSSLRIRMFDVGTRRRTEVTIPDVYDGVRGTNEFNNLHVHVHSLRIPGGRFWQPSPPMLGNLIVCDWRNSWTKTDRRGNPGGHFLNNMWYYAPPDIVHAEYANRECGMNGVALHKLARQLSSTNCSDAISFAEGGCLPAKVPIDILNGVVSAGPYTPPRWNSATNNMFIHQNQNGEKMLMRAADVADFMPGDIMYSVALRVSNALAMTDAEIAPVPHHALCVEYDALSCIVDPVSLTVKFEGAMSNRAWQIAAAETSVNIACSYDDGVHVSDVTLTEDIYIDYIEPRGVKSFYAIFDLPEEGIEYRNGVESPRLVDGPQFKCTVKTTSPVKNFTAKFGWTGTVDCQQLIRKVYNYTAEICPCDETSYLDVYCRVAWNCVNEGSDLVYFIVVGVAGAIDIGLVVGLIIYKNKQKTQAAKFALDPEHEKVVGSPGDFGASASGSDVTDSGDGGEKEGESGSGSGGGDRGEGGESEADMAE